MIEAGAKGFFRSRPLRLSWPRPFERWWPAKTCTPRSTTLSEVLDQYMKPSLDPGAASLTARERELLTLLGEGVSHTDELAERL